VIRCEHPGGGGFGAVLRNYLARSNSQSTPPYRYGTTSPLASRFLISALSASSTRLVLQAADNLPPAIADAAVRLLRAGAVCGALQPPPVRTAPRPVRDAIHDVLARVRRKIAAGPAGLARSSRRNS